MVRQAYEAALDGDRADVDQLLETVRSVNRYALHYIRRIATGSPLTTGLPPGDATRLARPDRRRDRRAHGPRLLRDRQSALPRVPDPGFRPVSIPNRILHIRMRISRRSETGRWRSTSS
jgi:hypothetical protein